ncbi:MAG: hypothetical protein RL398_538 [Planctomycetota bacterium]|jgi:imidazolonepropionase-like amidohydrolase
MNASRLAVAALLAASVATAQDLIPKAAPQRAPVLLRNAALHTMDRGIVLGGSLLIQDGKIAGLWTADQTPVAPPEATVLDLTGQSVFPGLISAHTTLGLAEWNSVRQSVDLDEVGEFSPEAAAAGAINPDSSALPIARSNGVLVAATFPTGGLLPGRVAVLRLDGWTNADLAVQADAGLVIAWPAKRSAGGPRRGRGTGGDAGGEDTTKRDRDRIDELFAAARAWLDARTADAEVPLDIQFAAMVPALRGEVPVFLLANSAEQITTATLWATGRGLRPVIVGGLGAVHCAELLRERKVPVILDGVHRLPSRDDADYDEAFARPAKLAELGVDFCIATGSDFSNDRNLPYHAATAAAFGLDRRQALAAITSDAARILGVGDRLGSLTVGKEATLFVADGHPFDVPTKVTAAYVRGAAIDLRNRHTELAAKYRERYRQLGITPGK